MTTNNKHINLIEERIVMESAAVKIQGLVRCKQAHTRLNILKKTKVALKKEFELFLVTGDLPSNHAMTLRVEGDLPPHLLLSSLLFLQSIIITTFPYDILSFFIRRIMKSFSILLYTVIDSYQLHPTPPAFDGHCFQPHSMLSYSLRCN